MPPARNIAFLPTAGAFSREYACRVDFLPARNSRLMAVWAQCLHASLIPELSRAAKRVGVNELLATEGLFHHINMRYAILIVRFSDRLKAK